MTDIFQESTENPSKPQIKKPGFKSKVVPKTEEVKEKTEQETANPKNLKIDNSKPVGKTVTVVYKGTQQMFNNPNLTLEDIRKDMEKDFPELTKSKTQMVFDEKAGLIIPWVAGKSAGGN